MSDQAARSKTGAVVIGRNEGARLVSCLSSLQHLSPRLVYVDSGSTDDSVNVARKLGAIVVSLDMSRPFTAARARNNGWRHLMELYPDTEFIQFVDGDCEVVDGWMNAAVAFLNIDKDYAVVCGRRRERYPEQSIYNRLCDIEWNTPVGDTKACGGDALVRTDALLSTQGYRDNLIAGEEPEWCVRLRDAGWKIHRLNHDMTLHDAAIHRFSQWWLRTKRAGFAFAAGAALHGTAPHFHWLAETRRAVLWGAAIPALSLIAALIWPPSLLAWPGLYALQILRLRARGHGWAHAFFLTLGKIAEASGVAQFHFEKAFDRHSQIIEYK